MRCKLALGQIRVEGGAWSENLQRAVAAIERAAQAGAHLIVLPECLDVGWTDPAAPTLAQPVPGPATDILARAAAAHGLHVVAGITERDGERLYNAAVLLGPDGRMLLHHRKINELDIGRTLYAVGDRLAVAQTPLGCIGLTICADNFPSSLALAHALCRMGAQWILSPSAWAVPPDHNPQEQPYGAMWQASYQGLAALYEVAVVGVSSVGVLRAGPWQGWRCIGCSLAVGPHGQVLARGPYGEEALLTVEVEPVPRRYAGTDWALALQAKGYVGP